MRRRDALVAAGLVLVWCVVELAVRRTASITDDFMGWRQADTQAIARHFAESLTLFHPRIDWGGDGSGWVETELQLYPALVALGIRLFGESVWPGQLLSLGATATAALVLHRALVARFGAWPALVALAGFLGTRGVVAIGTSIQPDALSLLAFVPGFVAFLRYLDEPSLRTVVAWAVATALAGLIKPTMLELGVVQLVLCLLGRREHLRDARLWAGWAFVVAVVGGYLLHARSLYLESGNTFGILSGGDSKLPTLARLLEPRRWFELLRYAVSYGTGWLALPAFALLVVRRRLGREEIALAAGSFALGLVAFRYMSGKYGLHYHLPAGVLGAWLVARATSLLEQQRRAAWLAVALGATLLWLRAVAGARVVNVEPETDIGHAVAAFAPPGVLVAVRARAPRWDEEWQTRNNFEDPRVFYLSRTHGWVLPNDEPGAAALDDYRARGALFYAHVRQKPVDAELAGWLASNATRLATSEAGEVFALRPANQPAR